MHVWRRNVSHMETPEEIKQILSAETIQLHRLFEQAPSFMCVLRGRDHFFELVNPSFLKLVGGRDILGKTMREGLPKLSIKPILVFSTEPSDRAKPSSAGKCAGCCKSGR